eukprot:m.386421 g.386421  ORF g.386421 m.386421 type:complete len:350 (-) comp28281_c0_seq16:6004-7053(-)
MSQVGGYTPSPLVEQLHGLPHYDFDFSPTSNEFDPDDARYLQSLAQFALPFLVASVVMVVATLCCCRCGNKREQFDTDVKQRGLVALTMLSGFTVAVSSIYFYGNQTVSIGVGNFLDSMTAAQAGFDSFFGKVATLKASVDESQQAIGDIPDSGADVEEKLQQINQTLVDARTFIDAISSNADSLDINGYRGVVEDGNRSRWIGFTVLGVLLVLTAIGYFLLRKNAGGPKRTVLCLGTLVSFLGLVVAGICLAIAVGVSDFCVAPNENILSVVGSGGGTSAQAAAFYINCPPGATNALTGDIMNASAKITQSITDLNELPANVTQDSRVSLTNTRTTSDAVSAASGVSN